MALYRQAGSSYRTRDKNGLTRAYKAVLEAIRKSANDEGTACLTNGELAHRADVSRRSVQAATAYLADNGFISKIERRRTRIYNDPNIYRLTDRKAVSQQGRKNRTQKPRRGESNNYTSCSTPSASDESCNHALRQAETGEKARRPTGTYRAPKTPALLRPDRDRITAAMRRLGIDLGNNLALTDGQLLERIDALRRERIPGFAATAWGYRATVHGVQAWFAVIETVGMMDGLIPQKDGEIRNPAAYLGGILWKAETDPRKTVTDWLEIEERKDREAKTAEFRAAYAAKQSQFDGLWTEAKAVLAESIPQAEIESWFANARILAVAEERVTLAFPTRFLKEYAYTHYRMAVSGAISRVRDESSSVVFTVRSELA